MERAGTGSGWSAMFPPHWAYESQATEWLWPWGPDAPEAPAPAAVIGNAQARTVLSASPTPGGSWVRAEPEGVVMHLSASDAASIKGLEIVFALWAAPPAPVPTDRQELLALADIMEPDACGFVVVSDWAAARPHAGTA